MACPYSIMKYLVHVRPPHELVEKMDSLLDITPVVERYLRLPHCTIMRLHSHSKNERRIIDEVRALAAGTDEFPLFTDELDLYSGSDGVSRTILNLKLQRSDALYGFHQLCITALVKYIDWSEARSALRVVPDNDTWRRYGDSFYGEAFAPHITLAKIDPAAFAALDAHQLAGFAWRVKTIYISRRDQRGWTTIAELPLRS